MYVNIHRMRTAQLTRILQQLAQKGRWLVSENTLRLFAGENINTFRVAMVRHVRAGTVRRLAPGLYVNPYVPQPSWALERCLSHLRPQDAYYVSLESAAHEHGVMSQIPNRLTLMTTGRSHTYELPGLGIAEFVHTQRSPELWRPNTTFIAERGIHVASAELAVEDLRRVGRNLDLIEIEAD